MPDILLGLATVDMAEVLGAKVHGHAQTTREQQRAVPVLVRVRGSLGLGLGAR